MVAQTLDSCGVMHMTASERRKCLRTLILNQTLPLVARSNWLSLYVVNTTRKGRSSTAGGVMHALSHTHSEITRDMKARHKFQEQGFVNKKAIA